MHNPTLMERQMAQSNGGGIGAKSYAQRLVGNGLEVDVQEVQPGHYRATVSADGGLAHKVFGNHFQADVARMGNRHFKGRVSTQAPAIAGAGARSRRPPVTRRALRPGGTKRDIVDVLNCYDLCKGHVDEQDCKERFCEPQYSLPGGTGPSRRRRGSTRRRVATATHADVMKHHLESAKQSRKKKITTHGPAYPKVYTKHPMRVPAPWPSPLPPGSGPDITPDEHGMGYGRSAPFSSYLPGVKDYWVYPDEPWADSVGPYAHYPGRPPFNVQYRGNKGMGNPETAGVFGPIAGRWPAMNRSVVGRSALASKAAARATTRKTSTVAQQLARRGTRPAAGRAQATLSANSAGQNRACDVGPADSWYWKHGPGGTYLCCSSGGDEACTHLF